MDGQERARWIKLVDDCRSSGLTQKEFARERGISYCQLRNHLYRLNRIRGWVQQRETRDRVSNQEQQKKDLRLVPVEVIASAPYGAAPKDGALELVLSSGMRLRFGAGTDIGYLRALAEAL